VADKAETTPEIQTIQINSIRDGMEISPYYPRKVEYLEKEKK
jgi:hypothetical protein